MGQLWKAFDGELKRLGVQTSRGKIVDASIVESTSKPRKKSPDEEPDETTEEPNPHRERQIKKVGLSQQRPQSAFRRRPGRHGFRDHSRR